MLYLTKWLPDNSKNYSIKYYYRVLNYKENQHHKLFYELIEIHADLYNLVHDHQACSEILP